MDKRKMEFIAVPVLLFVMLALCIQAGITVGWEGWVYRETTEDMSPALTAVMKGITHLGDPAAVIIFCLLLFVGPKARRSVALPVSGVVILSAVLNLALKNIFARERPDLFRLISETGYSFPSGHAMINASLYTMLILLIFRDIRDKPRRFVLSALCLAMVLLIGCSRIYLGVHYAGDILGGWLFGLAVSMFVYYMEKGRAGKRAGQRK